MSDYSGSEGSLIDDFNPAFKGGNSNYYKQTKSPFKEQTVRVIHSKLDKQAQEEAEQEESEDSEFAEDEDLCDEDEMFLRKRKKELKNKEKAALKAPAADGLPSEEEVMPIHPKELPDRETRGRRMNALVGQAVDEDDAFWGADIFQENEEDGSFDAASSEAKDSFDSDFDKSEHSNEGESAEHIERVAEKERKRKERAQKKVKFAVPAQRKKPKLKPKIEKKYKVEEDKNDEDRSSNASENIQLASRRSKRMIERKEDDSDDNFSESNDIKDKKKSLNPQKSNERKREIKEKNKAFLESHGIFGDVQDKWSELLSKDKLTPIEKVQEAALTEIINKESLSYLQELENERVNDMVYKDRRPKGPSVKMIQDIKPGHFNSRMIFPSSDFYPKNFNTRNERQKDRYYSRNYQMNT